MSKTFVYERFDIHDEYDRPMLPGNRLVFTAGDGEWVKAEDAINRDAVLNARIQTLEVQLQDTKRAAHAGMDAAKRTSTIQLDLAQKARAESSPEALASERAANALLTEENERLRAQLEPIARVHPDHTDSTLNATLPTWSDLSTLMRGLYSASFDYGAASMKDARNPHYQRVSNAQGRLRYSLHVLLGTEPTDANELAQINHARRDDGRPEIKVRGTGR